MTMTTEFGALLRQLRDRVTPGELGSREPEERKVPGLRREELAAYAGLSVDYVVRLEQGRSRNPSPQVVAALGRALRLVGVELDHFHRVAGQPPPSSGVVPGRISESVRRLLRRMADLPVGVYDAAWNPLTHNAPRAALLGDPPVGRDGNLAWALFAQGDAPAVKHEWERLPYERAVAADLRAAAARYPQDSSLRRLVADLRGASPAFAELWSNPQPSPFIAHREVIAHPEVGELELECDVLVSPENDLRVVFHTAEPDSESARRLARLVAATS
ncbi:HigA protein (antitoxin to HigB) [Actinosynnema pretiosum subsp. pretiosum]|nr:HigA protein (antitoxin to HigB) [Actinosynnema pretiosum subsp. pretiosum]